MRPLAVLLLIVAAIAALVFAVTAIGDSTGARDPQVAVTVGPARPGATPEKPRDQATELAPPVDEGRQEAAVEEPDRREIITEGEGHFPNELVGRVLDERGRDVAGARVSLFRRRGPAQMAAFIAALSDRAPERALRRMETGESGRFRFANLRPARDYVVVVDHDDYQRAEAGPIELAENGSVTEEIRLERGMAFFGFVHDHGTGAPIEGALVSLDDPVMGQLPAWRAKGTHRIEVETDEHGEFRFDHNSGGARYLMVVAAGYGTYVENNVLFNPKEPLTEPKIIRLEPELIIAGRVFAPDRSGIEGAKIDAISYQAETLSRGSSVTGANGEFVIQGLADAQYAITVSSGGWGERRLPRIRAGDENVMIEMTELGTVMGRVVDGSTGKPLSSFKVSVRQVNPNNALVGRPVAVKNVRNEPKGVFKAGGLEAGTFVVQAVAQGYAECRSEPFTITQGMTTPDVVVHMTRGGTIKGQLIDGYTGKPIQGALIKTNENNWVESPFTDLFLQLGSRTNTDAKTRTDKEGRFELRLLTPGSYQINVIHPDYTSVEMNDVRVMEGNETNLSVVKLLHGATVQGTVYSADGSPARGASVSLHASVMPGKSYETRANAEGRFHFRSVAAGTYKLSASRPNGSPGNPFQIIIDMKQSEIEIVVMDGRDYEQDLNLGGD